MPMLGDDAETNAENDSLGPISDNPGFAASKYLTVPSMDRPSLSIDSVPLGLFNSTLHPFYRINLKFESA